MRISDWLRHLRARFANQKRASRRGRGKTRPHFVAVSPIETLESRALLAIDYGDAPDTGAGTGAGNYNTLAADNGPSHVIVAGLFMGATVDGESEALPNARANGDDVNQALPDDEDGLNNPLADLTLTIGAAPTVNVIVTNTTGSPATLYGWIDYNANGLFDNANERASIVVPTGTTGGIKTLGFPNVPADFSARTFARFRLSTDVAGTNAIGAASNGEVEDYVVTIREASDATINTSKTKTIGSNTNGGPSLVDFANFGSSIASLGDLDGDGVNDLAVGNIGDDMNGRYTGAVYVLFMKTDGTVNRHNKIRSGSVAGLTLPEYAFFGRGLSALGDLDGDGTVDLAVGSDGDQAVYTLFLNSDGTPKSATKISGSSPSFPFPVGIGFAVTSLGDLDGDGVTDLAVGTHVDQTDGQLRGAVNVVFLNADGTVKRTTNPTEFTGGGPLLGEDDRFGLSFAALGDLDGDGTNDLAVGAYADDTGGLNRGAVNMLFMNPNGSVKRSRKIANETAGGPTLVDWDLFGSSVAAPGDLNGDGVPDLLIGARGDHTGGQNRGATYAMFLRRDGSARNFTKIANDQNGMPAFVDSFYFGRSVAALGDLDGDGVGEIVVGSDSYQQGTLRRGAVHVLFLRESVFDFGDAPAATQSGFVASFPTTFANDGARHITAGPILGANRDDETDGQPAVNSDGDDTAATPDDEDGITFVSTVLTSPSHSAIARVTINLQNPDPVSNKLDAWIDFNRDGDWNDAGEQVASSFNLGTTAGPRTLSFTVPVAASGGNTYARLRLSAAGGLAPTGPAPDGEVEDYRLTINGLPALTRMYRTYNPLANFHFFTTSTDQFNFAKGHGYNDEATGQEGYGVFPTQAPNATPIYRLYNLDQSLDAQGRQRGGFHYYTLNQTERDVLVSLVPPPVSGPDTRTTGWRDEGIEGYMYAIPQTGATVVYRLYNTDSGVHLYTHNPAVRDAVLGIADPTTGRHPWQRHSDFGYAIALSASEQIVDPESFGGGQSAAARRASLRVEALALETTPAIVTSNEQWSANTQRNSPSALAGLVSPVIGPNSDAVARGSSLDRAPSPQLTVGRTGALRGVTANAATLGTESLRGISMSGGLGDLTDDLFAQWDDFAELLP